MAKKAKQKIVKKRVYIKPTTIKRGGKTFKRKGYYKVIKEIENDKIGFEELQKRVAKNYEGKKVPKKYQKRYGKRYSKKEAMEVGARVAQKRRMAIFKKKGAKLSVK